MICFTILYARLVYSSKFTLEPRDKNAKILSHLETKHINLIYYSPLNV